MPSTTDKLPRDKPAAKRRARRVTEQRKPQKVSERQSPRSALGKYMLPGGMGHLG